MSNINSKTHYGLMDRNGNLIGLDQVSGGYPWVPDGLTGIWFCTNVKTMRRYQEQFPSYSFSLVEVSVSISPVPDDVGNDIIIVDGKRYKRID